MLSAQRGDVLGPGRNFPFTLPPVQTRHQETLWQQPSGATDQVPSGSGHRGDNVRLRLRCAGHVCFFARCDLTQVLARSDLSKNRITGPLPPLEHLLLIEELDLSNNLMSGPLDNLCGAPRILTVYLHQNDFTGGLPSCISTFSKLKVL